jgi:hypothetical protein
MYYVKVFGNPSDDNFGPFLLNLLKEVTSLERSLLTFPMSDRPRQEKNVPCARKGQILSCTKKAL